MVTVLTSCTVTWLTIVFLVLHSLPLDPDGFSWCNDCRTDVEMFSEAIDKGSQDFWMV